MRDTITYHSACCDLFRVTTRDVTGRRACTCEAQVIEIVPVLQQRTLLYEEDES